MKAQVPRAALSRRDHIHQNCPLLVAGIDVKADPSKRKPSTATFPDDTENCAKPRFPTIPLSPGRFRSAASVLLPGGSVIELVPMAFPLLSITVITTVAAVEPELTIAAAVVKFVSSNVSVFKVALAAENGTTAS